MAPSPVIPLLYRQGAEGEVLAVKVGIAACYRVTLDVTEGGNLGLVVTAAVLLDEVDMKVVGLIVQQVDDLVEETVVPYVERLSFLHAVDGEATVIARPYAFASLTGDDGVGNGLVVRCKDVSANFLCIDTDGKGYGERHAQYQSFHIISHNYISVSVL